MFTVCTAALMAGTAKGKQRGPQESTGKDALFEAMRLVAVANRNALDQWRSGSDLLPFLQRFTAPNR